jgi:hypothetical protein
MPEYSHSIPFSIDTLEKGDGAASLALETVLCATPRIERFHQYLIHGTYKSGGIVDAVISLNVGAPPFTETQKVDANAPSGSFSFLRTSGGESTVVLTLSSRSAGGNLDVVVELNFPDTSLAE